MPHRPVLRALALVLAVALPATLLGGCDAIYDDTKGWANRLEADVLRTAHEMAEPDPEAASEDMAAMAAGAPAPPAVPVEAVETAQLTPPPPALLPMTPDPGMMAEPATVAEAAPGPVPGLLPMTPDPGMMAAAAPENGLNQKSSKDTKAIPPHPLPKPEVPATAEAKQKEPAEKPAQTAAADAAHAVVLHLSSLRSEEAAKREWSDLQHSFPRPLAALPVEFRRTELGEKGTFYRVLAGPLPSRDKAKEVCAELKAKDAKQYCRILPSKADAS
jgi:hypothetical protein